MQYRQPHVNNIDGGRQTVCLLPMVTMGVENVWGYTWSALLAIQLVRCRVVGLINVFCWSPNYAIMHINVGETGGNCNMFHIFAHYVEHVFY